MSQRSRGTHARWSMPDARWKDCPASTCFRIRRTWKLSAPFTIYESMINDPIIDVSDFASLHKPFKQIAKLARPVEVLRVPLHAKAEAALRLLNRLADAVAPGRRRDEPFAERLRRLVMAAVDRARLAGFEA